MDVDPDNKAAFVAGVRKGTPLIFSAAFFGIIFGFTGAAGGIPFFWVSAMSYIIFAGSAQFITLVLLIEQEQLLAILVVAVILNLRHLLYGAVLHDIMTLKGIRKLLPAYFMTDESFLVTTLVHKEDPKLRPDFVLLGAGLTLWVFWNLTTIAGYLLYQVGEDLLNLPDTFVIAASFVGFLLDHAVRYPQDRGILAISTLVSLTLGWFTSSSVLLIVVMVTGAIYAMVRMAVEGDK
jgi:4-azaleucine resistance transporter AzlC